MVTCFLVTGSVARIVSVEEPRSVIVPGMNPWIGDGVQILGGRLEGRGCGMVGAGRDFFSFLVVMVTEFF